MTLRQQIANTVQHNCHLSDSRFAGEYTLCVYLLKMREFYRWEKKLQYGQNLPKDDVGEWLTSREQLWDTLDDNEYAHLDINDISYSPFESEPINAALEKHKLVYSGGIGLNTRPHFFLAELIRKESVNQYRLYIAGAELARDLTAPPAMSQGNSIYIRKESIRRMLWERLEEWRWKRSEGALARAFACFDFDNDLNGSLDQLTEQEADVFLQHEIGEIRAGEVLGDDWHDMLQDLPHSSGEIMLRSARDHFADCLTTLPMLLKKERLPSLHFYIGNLKGMRKELFPSLHDAYNHMVETGSRGQLQQLVEAGRQHWQDVTLNAVTLYKQHGTNALEEITTQLQSNRL